MVNHALGLVLVEHRTGMYADIHVGFGSFVYLISMILCAIHEETTDDTFSYVGVLIIFIDTQLFICNRNFDSLE